MTTSEILAAFKAGKITLEEADTLVSSHAASGGGLQVKRNSTGGLFIRHPALKGVSKEGKPYTISINLVAGSEPLFTNPEILKEVVAKVTALVKSEAK